MRADDHRTANRTPDTWSALATEIGSAFAVNGEFLRAIPWGGGHIHQTLLVEYREGGTLRRYVFQKINRHVFHRPEQVMDNIDRVLRHLAAKAERRGATYPLHLVPTRDGHPLWVDRQGEPWRVYEFVEGSISYDVVPSPTLAFEAARAFGAFLRDLADLPPPRLHETIPHFHDTPRRLQALERAAAEDRVGRAQSVGDELEFIRLRRPLTERLVNRFHKGMLPERITHNDTKINNVLFSEADGRALCVVDLDTVMPGLVHYDFGDLVRTCVSSAPEDERDLSQIVVRWDYFESLLQGYLETAGDVLTAEERRHLPFSGVLITLETGIRFLTDYLEGDVYFQTHYPGHNLDRARAQLRLAERLEALLPQMEDLLRRIESRRLS